MKWIKKGKIFDPTEHQLINGCLEFAQSPQTLVFDDFVRVYFSTRQKELNTGKYLSHIAYVDFDQHFNILQISQKEVISLGGLGCFDEHGIFPINVLRVEDKIMAFTCGWSRRVSVSVETSIGLAFSDDNGETFSKYGTGPILSSSLQEPVLVGDGFVKKFGDTFHMWYIFGTKWMPQQENEPPARVYKIGHAASKDAIHWVKDEGISIIADGIGPDECQALPTVVKINDRYHMYFCYRHSTDFRSNANRGYRIGYAFSDDLSTWKRDDGNVGISLSKDGWDSEMMCYPHLFQFKEQTYLLYNGNQFGRLGFGLAVLEV
jgi:hypothetical protein